MNRHALRSYGRTHDLDGAVEIEQSKIRKETGQSHKQRRRTGHVIGMLLKDPSDDTLAEREAELEREAARQQGNARTHKRRLKDLQKLGLE